MTEDDVGSDWCWQRLHVLPNLIPLWDRQFFTWRLLKPHERRTNEEGKVRRRLSFIKCGTFSSPAQWVTVMTEWSEVKGWAHAWWRGDYCGSDVNEITAWGLHCAPAAEAFFSYTVRETAGKSWINIPRVCWETNEDCADSVLAAGGCFSCWGPNLGLNRTRLAIFPPLTNNLILKLVLI